MGIDHSLKPELLLSAADAHCGCEDPHCDADQLAVQLDDKTLSYVLATRLYFEDLRQAVSQVAGMLVLASAGAKSVTQDHAMFAAAQEAHRRALDGIYAMRPTTRAAHHHRHLLKAAEDLGLALARSADRLHLDSKDAGGKDGVFGPLEAAYRNLSWASRTLPGFEVVNFDQACCAPQQAGPQ
jgi:hypothetical protein